MLLVAPGLATRNKRPLEPKASPLIENEKAGMRKTGGCRGFPKSFPRFVPAGGDRVTA